MGRYRCSYYYKRSLIERTVKELCGGRGAWKRSFVEQWIGFSLDEVGRMRQADGCRCGHKATHHGPRCSKCKCERFDLWLVNRWPLIDLRMRREDTIGWFVKNGHPVPTRSACWFCPNSGNDRWQFLRRDHPDLFERAVKIDVALRHGGGFQPGPGRTPLEAFLHQSRVPLRDADTRTRSEVVADAGQGSLFDEDALAMDCSAETCFT